MPTVINRAIRSCMIATLIAAPSVAAAKSASSLSDLVGARAGQAEGDLESRGFTYITGHKSSSAVFDYWWNSSRKDCVMVTTRDGRYASISDATPGDCHQKSGGSSAATVAGIAAGAALLAALASHKSGHHDDGKHHADPREDAEFERGFNAGLYNEPFRNGGNSPAYGRGYEAGRDQRNSHASARDNASRGSGKADLSDLQGARAAGALISLESRGFRTVDGFASGSNGRGTVWWNGRTRQCVQVITVDGRIDSVSDIGSHPRCR